MKAAQRLGRLPAYLFAELDRRSAEARARGADVIDLGIGDPDVPPPPELCRAVAEAMECDEHHRYPSYRGCRELRAAVARYYDRRFGVRLDPETEVLGLIGSKEGIAHLGLALVDPGDRVLVPDPGYPVYSSGTILAGGTPVPVPLGPDRPALPDLAHLPESAFAGAVLCFANSPTNPTGCVAELAELAGLVAAAARRGLVLAHDAAYAEVVFGRPPLSILQAPGARQAAVIEFGSLSKTFGMAGWRLGWAAGCAEVLAPLARVKTNVDSGVFTPLQIAAAAALDRIEEISGPIRDTYAERLAVLVEPLAAAGWPVATPLGTFYLWVPCPCGLSSAEFAAELLDCCSVVAAPGSGFGAAGEGFVRFSATSPRERLAEAARRMAGASQRWRWDVERA